MADKDPIVSARKNVAALVGRIRRILNTEVDRRNFELRLGDLLVRDIRGGPITGNDGYSAGAGGPGQINGISDRTGTHATALICDSGNGAANDVVHNAAATALADVENAITNLEHAVKQLEEVAKLTGAAIEIKRCELCTPALRGTGIEPDETFRRSDCAGHLPYEANCCRWHFDTIRKPPHKIPDDERILRRYTTGRDRMTA